MMACAIPPARDPVLMNDPSLQPVEVTESRHQDLAQAFQLKHCFSM